MSDEALTEATPERGGLRTGANEPTFHRALKAVATALDDAQVPHLFIGGLASMVHGRTSWTHDLDVMVAPRDQPAALEALVAAGFDLLASPASRLEICPFLGSYVLAEAVDRGGAQLALHGHAHRGTEKGLTPGGTLVRNVALPVLRRPYGLYCLGGDGTSCGS